MSEELVRKEYIEQGKQFYNFEYYDIGDTKIETLLRYNIIPTKDYGKFNSKKPDAIIVDRRNKRNIQVIAVVEFKKPSELNTKEKIDKASKQCNSYCQILGAKIGIISDTINFYWINSNDKNGTIRYSDDEIFDNVDKIERYFNYITDENNYEITNKINFSNQNESEFNFFNLILDCVNEDNSSLKKTVFQNPSKLARSIWQDVWISKSASPEKALSTFIEIFMFKYLSDIDVLKQNSVYVDISFDSVYNIGKNGCLTYYYANVRNYIKTIFPINNNDGTTLINGMSLRPDVKEDNLTFYNILNKFKDFGNLKDIDPEFKSRLFEDFLKKSISKKNWGQFFTPRNIIKAIINMSEIDKLQDGSNIGDPASGVGGFLLEPMLLKRKNDYYFDIDNKLKCKVNYEGFEKGFELEEKLTTILAKANFIIFASDLLKNNPTLTVEFANMFNKIFTIYTNTTLGSLSNVRSNYYELILSNPPYVTDGSQAYKKAILEDGILSNKYKLLGVGIESLFVEKIINELKPKGSAYIILPSGIFSKEKNQKLRNFISKECVINAIISLPTNAFYTTPQKTYILSLTKKTKPNNQTEPIFTYIISNIGETLDTNRFSMENNDLIQMSKEYRIFMLDKSEFENIKNERLKIINYDDINNGSWLIDDFWTQEEKINLGVTKEVVVLDVESIEDEISKLKKTLDKLKKEINIGHKDYKYMPYLLDDLIDFTLTTNNSDITKSYVDANKGDIPVYSASKDLKHGGYGYIRDNIETVKYFNDCLTWNIDGSIGKAHYRKGRFSLSEKVIPLVLKDEYKDNVDYTYLKYVLESLVLKMGFNFLKKAGKSKIRFLEIPIPVNVSNFPDLKFQKNISKKYSQIDKLKLELKHHFENLANEYELDIN